MTENKLLKRYIAKHFEGVAFVELEPHQVQMIKNSLSFARFKLNYFTNESAKRIEVVIIKEADRMAQSLRKSMGLMGLSKNDLERRKRGD